MKGKNNLGAKANKSLMLGIAFLVVVIASFYIVFIHQVKVDRWYYVLPIMLFMVLAGYFIKRGAIFRFGAKGNFQG